MNEKKIERFKQVLFLFLVCESNSYAMIAVAYMRKYYTKGEIIMKNFIIATLVSILTFIFGIFGGGILMYSLIDSCGYTLTFKKA